MEVQFSKAAITSQFATLLLSAVALASVFLAAPALAAVASISDNEDFTQYGQEEAYWTVDVRCQGSSSDSVIQRKTDGVLWCAKSDTSLCDESKSAAAELVCSESFVAQQAENDRREAQRRRDREAQQAREAQARRDDEQRRQAARNAQAAPTVTAPSAAAKLQNQISIQEQRLAIEQERLRLRQREIELEQRAKEIEEQLQDLG